MGLNQITAVFAVEYEQYINLENYDRIARYFNFDDDGDDDDVDAEVAAAYAAGDVHYEVGTPQHYAMLRLLGVDNSGEDSD